MDKVYVLEELKDFFNKNKRTNVYNAKKFIIYSDFQKIFGTFNRKQQYDIINILNDLDIELLDEVPKGSESQDTNELSSFEVFEENLLDFDAYNQIEEENYLDLSSNYFISSHDSLSEKDYQSEGEDKYDENIGLCIDFQKGNRYALDRLCILNKRLVLKISQRYINIARPFLDEEDLFQYGMIGFIKSVEKFNISYGTRLSTYAIWWIKQSITRAIADFSFSIRVPVHMQETINKISRVERDLLIFNPQPTFKERIEFISNNTSFTNEQIEYALVIRETFRKIASTDVPIGEDKDTPLKEFILDENCETTEEVVERIFLKKDIDSLLKTLGAREEKIIRLRFGIDDGNPLTLEQIGHIFNVTRERIRQIEAKALKKLRHPSRSKKIKNYLFEENNVNRINKKKN